MRVQNGHSTYSTQPRKIVLPSCAAQLSKQVEVCNGINESYFEECSKRSTLEYLNQLLLCAGMFMDFYLRCQKLFAHRHWSLNVSQRVDELPSSAILNGLHLSEDIIYTNWTSTICSAIICFVCTMELVALYKAAELAFYWTGNSEISNIFAITDLNVSCNFCFDVIM